MRPRTLDEFVGQAHLLGPGRALRLAIERREVPSAIFWGPPGSGKTTLVRLIGAAADLPFLPFSAVTSGIREIKEVIAEAEAGRRRNGRSSVLFVDEIHRFNKAQQDAFLPHVERGTIVLLGATTENPSFEVIAPLLSRARVFVLHPLEEAELVTILQRALGDRERGLGAREIEADPEALAYLARMAAGDARAALNTLELAAHLLPPGERRLTRALAEEAGQRRSFLYDKAGEEHYNLISAFHKSLRDSDPDAALYWLARMLASGEDPLYVARRMIRFAAEDIGIADPRALGLAVAAKDAYHFLGSPEGELALAQCAVYLATAPKSNAVYAAFGEAQADVRHGPLLPVPLHIRNAPTPLMKEVGYGAGYRYAHDFPDALVAQSHLPDALRDRTYYRPSDRGYEAEIRARLADWRRRLAEREEGAGAGNPPEASRVE
jgi:putative ATPase